MIQLHSNDNFLQILLLLDMNTSLHCIRGVAMDTGRPGIFQGPQQPLSYQFHSSFTGAYAYQSSCQCQILLTCSFGN